MSETRQSRRVPFWRSLQAKYALTYVVVIAGVLALLNTYPVLRSQDSVFHSKATALQSQALVISSALAGPDGLSADGVGRVMAVLGGTGLSRVLVTDANGATLYDSRPDEDLEGRYALLAEVVSALRGYDVFRCDYVGGAFHSRAAAPVVYRGMTVGAVYLDELDAEQGQMLSDIQQTLRNISIIIAIVALGLSILFSKMMTRRFGRLLGAIHTVREGEYSHRVRMRGGDELSQLAGEFNDLTDRLQTTEEVRRRFVSDASHELKTPLASIRLLSDSILQNGEMDGETVRDFVGDIGEEAGRLQRITEKLLTLTRLDASTLVEAVPVKVEEVAQRVEHMLSPLAQAAEVSIVMELEHGVEVMADADDLYQVLFNLVENGIKYNLPGGQVKLTVLREEEKAVIAVEDTGVGIPAQDIDKVFDRFYRVDKARSRAAGGTGLGLSIVRDTISRYQGEIEVRPRGSGGTRFIVTFPAHDREEGET